MAVVELLFGRKKATKFTSPLIGSLQLDCTLSESAEYSNQISSFPIESGAFISDHVIHEPEEVTLSGLITRTPIEFLGNLGKTVINSANPEYQEGNWHDPVLDGYEYLLALAGYGGLPNLYPNGEYVIPEEKFGVIDIVTETRAYTSMALTRLSVPRDPETGESLKFTASFRKVKFVSTQYDQTIRDSTKASRVDKQGATKADMGNQNGDKVVSGKSLKSVFKAGLDGDNVIDAVNDRLTP